MIYVSGGQVYMIDFGLAERFDRNRLTEAVGTPYYVAPEVLKMMDEVVFGFLDRKF